jgi:hypothetical protein
MTGTTRRIVIIGVAVVAAAIVGFGFLKDTSSAKEVLVYKTPTCGCCGKWVDHLKSAGYEVTTQDVNDLTGIKNMHKIPRGLRTCHTGLVDGYVIEGHVPARFVTQLLDQKPDIAGIGVPGMPIGSPGMEGAYNESYDVLAYTADGRTAVFGHVQGDPGR